MTAILGVEKSLTAQHWTACEVQPEDVADIARRNGITETVARLLAVRKVAPENVPFFLHPTFKDHLPDPYILKDMEQAAKRLADAICNGEKIAVFGDYDVDGATSTALMVRFLTAVCDTVPLARIPERDEGYGPSHTAMDEFIQAGINLVVTVDCGTTAFDQLKKLADNHIDAIVIDHHEPAAELPEACAIVNPKRLDEPTDNLCRNMAAVGVVFMTVIAVNRLLRERGRYTSARPEPNLMKWLDLVALGTVCDVVRLRGLNRLFVKSGLNRLSAHENKGLKVLSDLSKIKEKPTAFHLGFLLGPRLNACGRIGKADLGMRLLCANDEAEALDIAKKLDELNVLRKQMCEEIYKQALFQTESADTPQNLVFVAGKDWHAGVVGIIAGRLKERYKVPSLVFSITGDEAKGSGRSVAGCDLGAAVLSAKEQGILTTGGGHALAAGVTLPTAKLDEFKAFLTDYFANHKSAAENPFDYQIDSIVDIGAISDDLLQTLSEMAPFGEGNPEPRFAVADVAVSSARLVGTGHVSCCFVGRNGRSRLRAIAFKAADSVIGTSLLNAKGTLFHVAGYIRPDTHRGEGNVQFIIEDLAQAG